jgi:hypothetical protein
MLVIIACTVACSGKRQAINVERDLKDELPKDMPQYPPQEEVEYSYAVRDSVVDSLEMDGLPFKVNGIKCFWKYKLHVMYDKPHPVYNLRIISQQLIKADGGKLFTATTSPDDYFQFYTLADIKNSSELNLVCTDINIDTFCDYQIMVERAAAGANTTYETYLFNPTTKTFEHSDIFSGTNVEYDPKTNRISTMWKMSVDDYSYTYINLKPNKRDVYFTESVHEDGDTITYTKIVEGKVVEHYKKVNREE